MQSLTLKTTAVVGAALAYACGGTPASAEPLYQQLTTIAIPSDASNPNTPPIFNAFDISFFDPTTQLDYVADRSNAGIDIFSAKTDTFVGRIPGFVGQVIQNGTTVNSLSGPDGVLVVSQPGQHQLFGGDGDSTLKGFTIPATATNVAGYTSLSYSPLSTGGNHRVDEMAYSPATNQILAANNADTPTPFATLINATTGAKSAKIFVPGATGGIEQPVWDPTTGHFWVSIPQFNGAGPGGLAEIATDGTVTKTIDFGDTSVGMTVSTCSPAGLVRGGSGNLMVGCGNASQSILFNPTTGKIVKTFPQISGSDELWYDPTLHDFFITGANNPGGSVFGIVSDLTDTFLYNVATATGNAHSISVDPISGKVFIPVAGGAANTVCPNGCIEVFASVPEPSSLPLLFVGMAGLIGVAAVRRQSR
jgi:hypothetical protein